MPAIPDDGRRLGRAAALVVAALVVSEAGCASHDAAALPTAPDTHAQLQPLKSDVSRFRLEPLKPIKIDPRDGLDSLEVAVLAVLNSPDLEAKRAALGVKAAEVFAAGLLPDPQITAGVDQPIAGPDHFTAYSVSPALDLAGVLQRASARRAAVFSARQADLDLLWAEWGVAQQARALAVTALAEEAKAVDLRPIAEAAERRYAQSSRALARHDVTSQTVATDLAVKVDAETQLATATHDAEKARRDLDVLLNLDARVRLPLVPEPSSSTYGSEAVDQALASLPTRRPDLLALKAGYQAQDANLRKAVIAQFPLNQIAAALARDTAGVTTIGASAVLALPIFNGGRGEVRLQSATREQLRAEYQARLDQTRADVRNAEAELSAATGMAKALEADAPRLEALAAPAQAAIDRGDLDSQAYLALLQSALATRADLADRELAARTAEIQLETELFLPPAGSRAHP